MKIRPSAALGALALALLAAATPTVAADGPREVQTLLRQGKHTEALTLANSLVERQPRDAEARFLKGVALAELGRQDEAIAIFLKLTQDFPAQPEAYNNLAVLYAQQKQYDKARATLESALRTHPSYAVAHQNLGNIYARLASQAYEKALQPDATRSNSDAPARLALLTELSPSAAPTQVARADAQPKPAPAPALVAAAPAAPAAKPAPPPVAPAPVTPPPAAPVAVRPVVPAAPPTAAPTVAVTPPAAPAPASAVPPAAAAAPAASAPQANVRSDPAASDSKPATADKPATDNAALRTVQAWAQAWSRKDVKAYLALYDKDFEVPDGRSRSVWERERQQRVGKAGPITVDVENPRVSISGDRATVRFQQHYRSSGFNGSTNKTLELVRRGDQWRIRRELVGG